MRWDEFLKSSSVGQMAEVPSNEKRRRIQEVFESMDQNHDGSISSRELKHAIRRLGVRVSNDQVRKLMRKLDTNGDGVLDIGEFVHFLDGLPVVNPHAMFELFQQSVFVDDAQSEYTPPRAEHAATKEESLLSVLAAKLYSGSVAGATSRTCTAPIDLLKVRVAHPVPRRVTH